MLNPEKEKQAEIMAERKFVKWARRELINNAGYDFTDDEIKEKLGKYLRENNKSILSLTKEDKDNICSDILIGYLDSPESDEWK
jgi:hypothetical protein